jgi:cytochrome c biogenesis protein CcdA
LKAYNYFTLGISLIFLVMGILILTGAYNTGELFRNNEFVRYIMGFILIVYGIFRAFNAWQKIKNPAPKRLRYYDNDEDEN